MIVNNINNNNDYDEYEVFVIFDVFTFCRKVLFNQFSRMSVDIFRHKIMSIGFIQWVENKILQCLKNLSIESLYLLFFLV